MNYCEEFSDDLDKTSLYKKIFGLSEKSSFNELKSYEDIIKKKNISKNT